MTIDEAKQLLKTYRECERKLKDLKENDPITYEIAITNKEPIAETVKNEEYLRMPLHFGIIFDIANVARTLAKKHNKEVRTEFNGHDLIAFPTDTLADVLNRDDKRKK